jgi:tRNA nucleotidyltransferase/poly(A) polymerase
MAQEMRLFQVGGCVRDELLGLSAKDIDFAVEAASFEVMKEEMSRRGFIVFQARPEFLTLRAKFPGGKLVADFVLCRTESGFTDSRHPDRVERASIRADLERRDFTVNAIAKCVESGEIIDPHGGQEDLRNKRLRAVGCAKTRLREDALRCLRALRFSVTIGLEIDPDLWEAFTIPDLPLLLESVSVDRKREELGKAFSADSLMAMRSTSEASPALAGCHL